MISRALLNAPFFIPKDADLLRNRKVNTKKRQNRHLPELAFLILGTYFTAPFFTKNKGAYLLQDHYGRFLFFLMSYKIDNSSSFENPMSFAISVGLV